MNLSVNLKKCFLRLFRGDAELFLGLLSKVCPLKQLCHPFEKLIKNQTFQIYG